MDKKRTVIGKDVIESLTLGMYEDSRFIYREYIQNSADQIDKAVNVGLLKSKDDGNIWIDIEKQSKKIIIRDDATGIESNKVEDILKDIAQSKKVRGQNKGFRGIGRLGGLGYCDELRFVTSHEGENVKTIMSWDARKLKNIINDRTKKESASDVIDEVTSFLKESEKIDAHYFIVELIGVNNNDLLDREKIYEYLSMVAPVPFTPRFIFNEKIYDYVNLNNYLLDEYSIFLKTDQVFKEYKTSIYKLDGKKKDEIKDVKIFQIDCKNGGLLAWGWYSITNFDGVIQNVNKARGIRLRKDNIQIGSETTLAKFHLQKKNQNYFFGEVHAVHDELIPNARRDYFVENEKCKSLENGLKQLFNEELKPLFNIASKLRSADRSIDILKDKQREIRKLESIGITNKEERVKIEVELDKKTESAEKGKKYLKNIKKKIEENNDETLKKLYENIVKSENVNVNGTANKIKNKLKKVPHRTDKYSKLSRKERKIVTTIFDVIDSVLGKDLAENLKQKIDEKFLGNAKNTPN